MRRREQSLDADDALRLLVPERRRAMLRVLLEQPDGTTDLSTLARQVTLRCYPEVISVTSADIEVRLHHTDLPKLTDAGLITYDSESRSVSYVGDRRVEALLETLDTRFD